MSRLFQSELIYLLLGIEAVVIGVPRACVLAGKIQPRLTFTFCILCGVGNQSAFVWVRVLWLLVVFDQTIACNGMFRHAIRSQWTAVMAGGASALVLGGIALKPEQQQVRRRHQEWHSERRPGWKSRNAACGKTSNVVHRFSHSEAIGSFSSL
jgi:hypothetical protein